MSDQQADRTISVRGLSKTFGQVAAVKNLSFEVGPGRVTGFLGPNGAGKTTTLRTLLGLVTPTAGTATIGGRRYAELAAPQRTVGALLESSSFHPGRTGRDHLRVLAHTAQVGPARIDEVLAMVGLADAARRRVGGYSLGMRQRLGLACALLSDPGVFLLDEPANGLDPEGIVWLRSFLRYLAAEGRTVLVSSHVLSEVQQTVDDVVIIARGELIRQAPLAELSNAGDGQTVRVLTPQPQVLLDALHAAGLLARTAESAIEVSATSPSQVGHLAFVNGVELHELAAVPDDLESVFLALVDGANGANEPHLDNSEGRQPAVTEGNRS